MSVAISQPVHAPAEPFGQTGIRQYLGSFATFFCAIAVAACLTLWFRSSSVMDTLEFYQDGYRTILQSANGRFILARVDSVPGELPPGWAYNSRQTFRTRIDRWPDSVWKLIGIEFRHDMIFGRPGWWLRVKWPFAAAVFGIVPAMHVVGQMRRSRRTVAVDAKPAASFCPRCGRPIDQTPSRCSCCGRDVGRASIIAAP